MEKLNRNNAVRPEYIINKPLQTVEKARHIGLNLYSFNPIETAKPSDGRIDRSK